MKRKYIFLSLAIIFFPLTLSVFFERSWQESLLFLIASGILLLLINMEKFEIFKLGNKGIELKMKIEEVDIYTNYLKENILNLLNLHIDVIMRLGNNAWGVYDEIKNITKTVESSGIEDENIEKKIDILRKRAGERVLRDSIEFYKNSSRNRMNNEQDTRIWKELIVALVPDYTDDLGYLSLDLTIPTKKKATEAFTHFVSEVKKSSTFSLQEDTILWANRMIEIVNYSYN